jgi:hypothetical protein
MVFNDSELEQFISEGYVILRRAFHRELATQCREFVWNQIPQWDHCTTYGQPMVQIKKGFDCAPFDRIMNQRLSSSVDQLVGPGRWKAHGSYGYFTLLLPGFPGPGGWHTDDFNSSTDRFDSPLKAVVTVFLFSDAGPGDGGTPLIRGSHFDVARLLAQPKPDGLEAGANFKDALAAMAHLERVVSVTGEAGDVALLHPFMVHGFGPNTGTRIRFACNPLFQLTEPLKSERPDGNYSAVELATREAIELRR